MNPFYFFLTLVSWIAFGLYCLAQGSMILDQANDSRHKPVMFIQHYIVWAITISWLITYYTQF